MPFPMVHLSIAKNILNSTSIIAKPDDFLLGSIAPDSVHFRSSYNSDMKKASHLCVGEKKWGQLTNNSEWSVNVLKFLESNLQSGNIDFIYGYCSHILADIRNNIVIWTPFRMEHQEELEKGIGSQYHKEAADVDYELFRTFVHRDAIWELLKKSDGCDICGVVNGVDIDAMKTNLLYHQFVKREPVDLSANKYVTVKNMLAFITNESEYIKEQLLSIK